MLPIPLLWKWPILLVDLVTETIVVTVSDRDSGFVRQIQKIRDRESGKRKLINSIVDRCWALSDAELPPLGFIKIVGSDSTHHFKVAMCSHFSEFMQRFDLGTDARILDIGCGCGRIAIPFAMHLSDGHYYGIDVWGDGIDWCKRNVSAGKGNFSFHLIDSENNYYFDDFDAAKRNKYALDFIGDQEIDFSFALSVFTHLTRTDSQSYLNELGRTLKKGGAAYVTAFIIDEFFFQHVAQTGEHRTVKEVDPGSYQAYHGQDFFAGFTRKIWNEMLGEAGLRVLSHELGSWANKPGARVYQDTFLVMPTKV